MVAHFECARTLLSVDHIVSVNDKIALSKLARLQVMQSGFAQFQCQHNRKKKKCEKYAQHTHAAHTKQITERPRNRYTQNRENKKEKNQLHQLKKSEMKIKVHAIHTLLVVDPV